MKVDAAVTLTSLENTRLSERVQTQKPYRVIPLTGSVQNRRIRRLVVPQGLEGAGSGESVSSGSGVSSGVMKMFRN